MTKRHAWALVAVAVVVAAAVLFGRSGDGSTATPAPAASSAPPVRVVLPGRPGESAAVTDSDNVRAPDGSTYNAIDTAFVQMMIAHHTQAIAMADLAPSRAADAGVRALAQRISAAQAPEAAWLRAWLTARNLPESDPAHDHAAMPGMQTPEDVALLAATRGAAFDRRFVTMMTAHHRGALQMAGDVLKGGTDQSLQQTANEMAVEQGSEIRRLAQLNPS